MIRVSPVSGRQIRVAWDSIASKSYKILGTTALQASMVSWETVVENIAGVNGEVAVTLDIPKQPQYALRDARAVTLPNSEAQLPSQGFPAAEVFYRARPHGCL